LARKRNPVSSIRSWLYGLARFLGDVQALSKGPEAVAKRAARKAAGRAMGRILDRLFK